MSEITVESLQEELKTAKTALEEASKGQMSNEDRDRLTFLEGDNKTLIEARDKLKEEKRIAVDKKLIEDGEFKTLAESKALEVEDLTKQLEGLNSKLGSYQERDEKEFKAILETVPEALRDKIPESMTIGERLDLARALSTQKQPPAGYRQPGEPVPTTLQTQYDEAVKTGNVSERMRLKREMFEAKE